MKIGLIDVDGKIPNLALVKIAAWHKAQGDEVDWFKGNQTLVEKIYASKIFNFSTDFPWHMFDGFSVEIVKGGTGYDIKRKLPPEIEAMAPDYSIYPNCDYGIGFMTRGCTRRCKWCVVPEKEGDLRPDSSWREVSRWPVYRKVIFLDNNALASEWALQQLENMIAVNQSAGRGHTVMIDFNQGLDARLIDDATAKLLSRLHWIRFIRLACDSDAMIGAVQLAIMHIRRYMPGREIFIYLLVDDVDDAEFRMHQFREIKGLTFFAQPFRNPHDPTQFPTEEQFRFARFVNIKGGKLCQKMAFKDYKRI